MSVTNMYPTQVQAGRVSARTRQDDQSRLMRLTELAVDYLRRWPVTSHPNRKQCRHG
jgi:hypothetical protein